MLLLIVVWVGRRARRVGSEILDNLFHTGTLTASTSPAEPLLPLSQPSDHPLTHYYADRS